MQDHQSVPIKKGRLLVLIKALLEFYYGLIVFIYVPNVVFLSFSPVLKIFLCLTSTHINMLRKFKRIYFSFPDFSHLFSFLK